VSSNVVAREAVFGSISELGAHVCAQPQPDQYKTTHRFANGMYCRTMWMPAGHLVIGARHLHEHVVVMLHGEMLIYTEEGGTVSFKAGDVFTYPKGAQRAIYSVTDAEMMAVHRLPNPNERDLDKIWDAVVDTNGLPRLYDSNNRALDSALTNAAFTQVEQE
jgi:hypothetical protein